MKSYAQGTNQTGDPEAQIKFKQFKIHSSKMGQVLKAAEKLTELQTNAFQGQSSRKQNAQPNKSNQQGRYQQSGSDQASRKRKDSEHQFARKASSNKN